MHQENPFPPEPAPAAAEFDHLPAMDRLRAIMKRLRGPGGCPWDAEQTHESLLPHLIEEAYEVADAVRSGDPAALVDELGDLLLQPVFHAEIAAGLGTFDLDDVARAIGDKLVRRHPHVFAGGEAADSAAVLAQWERIKAEEKGGAAASPYLAKANEGLPALMSASKLQKRASKVGFDWPEGDPAPLLGKILEEVDEVAEALESGNVERVAEEIGDLLFSVVNLSRKQGLCPELLLHRANAKFTRRFQRLERDLQARGLALEDASLEQMDAAWESIKEGQADR